MELKTINHVSKAYGISTRMLRYYEDIGLIHSQRKDDYAYRVYDDTALLRLQQIIVLRKLRVPMKHIQIILDNLQTSEALVIFIQNINELDDEIKNLSTIRDILIRLLGELRHSKDIYINYSLLTNSSMLSIVENLSLSKNLIKEASSMENPKKAEAKIIPFGKHLWRVLEEKDGKMLIITENIVEERSYHSEAVNITWEHCEMRQHLNGSFYESFTLEEQLQIQETQVSDRDNPWHGTECGNPTVDKIFLLSYDEVIKYFGDSGDLQGGQGWNWTHIEGLEGGVAVKGGTEFINDQYNSTRRVYKADGSISWWWLRSPGGQGQHTTGSIGLIGEIFLCGDDVWMRSREESGSNGGIRPAMWISCNSDDRGMS
ncbi:MAG: MerR family transcriptional regulator [Defluviitaleaceae bacterium]|nr:MerR family transcriptional regulator [Defluviitaleaceae bacterium]